MTGEFEHERLDGWQLGGRSAGAVRTGGRAHAERRQLAAGDRCGANLQEPPA